MKLYEKVAAQLRQQIDSKQFAEGERLPSVRKLSVAEGVSVTTVQEAYRELEAAGLIEARPKSGYFVCTQGSAPLPEVSRPVKRPLEISQWEHVMELLGADGPDGRFSLGHAMPDITASSLKPLLKFWADQARHNDLRVLEYDGLRGNPILRGHIANLMLASGANVHPDEVIVTSGCQESLSAALRAVTVEGGVVAVDSPCFYGSLQAVKSCGVKVLEIPTDPQTGISVEALQMALEQWPVSAIMITPTCNNPLGFSMPVERRRALYQLAQRFDVPIIEDDIYGDLAYSYPRPRSIKSLDTDGRVLLCSSFSKTMAPGLRVGWIAPGRWRDKVVEMKYVSTASTSTFPQLVISRFIAEGGYERHVRRMRAQYQRHCTTMTRWLEKHFPAGTRISHPQGGYLLWVELDDAIDCVELNRRCAEFSLASGVLFSATGKYRNCLRLNFTHGLEPKVEAALKVVAAAVEQMLKEKAALDQESMPAVTAMHNHQ